ncbi:MAG: helix-turn-helix domain-containing protein [Desulfomonilaceae bacterium]
MVNNETGKENEQERIPVQKLLSARDVAEILGISVKTVNKLVRKAKLGCVQVTAKERRFSEEQIREYIESRTTKIQIDRTKPDRVKSQPPKGGEKSYGDSRTSLLKEMSLWQ